ncbi:accessory gene regulator B family protein [Paenibacillus hunanensis]|uniref:Accessory gene regulator B n=1 Tax=Paenibacillus hunanensis TaxID=539262 RepID=A0ABU1IXL2_9BACL|nr:accessory gene regulator B [Paenibacillus hunanensis]
MIESISVSLAKKIQRSYPPASVEIMAYEIARKINFWAIIVLTVLVSWRVGDMWGSILSMCSFALVRYWSGGKHFNLTLCTIVSVALFVITPLIPITQILILLIGAVTLLVFFFKTNSHRRIYSCVFIVIAASIDSSILILTFCAQAILLLWREDNTNEKNS